MLLNMRLADHGNSDRAGQTSLLASKKQGLREEKRVMIGCTTNWSSTIFIIEFLARPTLWLMLLLLQFIGQPAPFVPLMHHISSE